MVVKQILYLFGNKHVTIVQTEKLHFDAIKVQSLDKIMEKINSNGQILELSLLQHLIAFQHHKNSLKQYSENGTVHHIHYVQQQELQD